MSVHVPLVLWASVVKGTSTSVSPIPVTQLAPRIASNSITATGVCAKLDGEDADATSDTSAVKIPVKMEALVEIPTKGLSAVVDLVLGVSFVRLVLLTVTLTLVPMAELATRRPLATHVRVYLDQRVKIVT